MNKYLKMALILVFAIFFVFVVGCEGPEGPSGSDGSNGSDGIAGVDGTDGTDGSDGVDGNITCLVCHSNDNLIDTKRHEFAISQHAVGDIAVGYAGGRGSCARCHSHQGFVAFASGLPAHNISNPQPWECATCHQIHQTFDESFEDSSNFALRLTEAEAIFDGGSFDMVGNNNLCANCHQSRRAEPNISDPGDTFTITSTHYGPHHGPQSNVLAGVGFAEIPGDDAYPTTNFVHFEQASCTGCHMSDGNHSFDPEVDACKICHSSATDFDVFGGQTAVNDLLDELRDMLVDKGVIELGTETIFELDPETGDIVEVTSVSGYHPVVGTYDMILAQAFFNWVGLDEDRSKGVHNPPYVKALLNNTIDAVEAL